MGKAQEKKDRAELDSVYNKGRDITNRGSRGKIHGYGLCSRCSNLGYTRHLYGKEVVLCDVSYDVPRRSPSRENPVTDCTAYYPAGQMSLRNMAEIATLIDDKGPRKIGFIPDRDVFDD
jgi:hypothetical protein